MCPTWGTFAGLVCDSLVPPPWIIFSLKCYSFGFNSGFEFSPRLLNFPLSFRPFLSRYATGCGFYQMCSTPPPTLQTVVQALAFVPLFLRLSPFPVFCLRRPPLCLPPLFLRFCPYNIVSHNLLPFQTVSPDVPEMVGTTFARLSFQTALTQSAQSFSIGCLRVANTDHVDLPPTPVFFLVIVPLRPRL